MTQEYRYVSISIVYESETTTPLNDTDHHYDNIIIVSRTVVANSVEYASSEHPHTKQTRVSLRRPKSLSGDPSLS